MTGLLTRIVSGGQTGVDRGALDAALEWSFPCGGWCPQGRQAEDGVIPDRYPVVVLAGAGECRGLRRHGDPEPRRAHGRHRTDQAVLRGVWDGRSRSHSLRLLRRRPEPRFRSPETKPRSEKGPKAAFSDRRYRPCLAIDAAAMRPSAAAQAVVAFLGAALRQRLNVAGPRASGWSDGYAYARAVVGAVIQYGSTPTRRSNYNACRNF
jgi:hypothetical protein